MHAKGRQGVSRTALNSNPRLHLRSPRPRRRLRRRNPLNQSPPLRRSRHQQRLLPKTHAERRQTLGVTTSAGGTSFTPLQSHSANTSTASPVSGDPQMATSMSAGTAHTATPEVGPARAPITAENFGRCTARSRERRIGKETHPKAFAAVLQAGFLASADVRRRSPRIQTAPFCPFDRSPTYAVVRPRGCQIAVRKRSRRWLCRPSHPRHHAPCRVVGE